MEPFPGVEDDRPWHHEPYMWISRIRLYGPSGRRRRGGRPDAKRYVISARRVLRQRINQPSGSGSVVAV